MAKNRKKHTPVVGLGFFAAFDSHGLQFHGLEQIFGLCVTDPSLRKLPHQDGLV
jgi:hypothetical protein